MRSTAGYGYYGNKIRLEGIIMLLALFSSLMSHGLEYFFAVIPCELCIITRHIYLSITVLLIWVYICEYANNRFFNNIKFVTAYVFILRCILGLVLISLLGVALYHMAVEMNWVQHKCTGTNLWGLDTNGPQAEINLDHVRDQIDTMTAPPCNVPYKIWGVNLTWVNLLIAILINAMYYMPRVMLKIYANLVGNKQKNII